MDLVLISGHSSGLGLELTKLYLEAEATVIGMARRPFMPKHARLYQFHFDLSKTEGWESKLRSQLPPQKWTRVLLFNNAGTIEPTAPFGQMDGEEVSRALALNVAAPLRLMNLVLNLFPQTPIRIANISSGAAKKPYPGWGVYCSSKASLEMASQVLAVEMQAAGRDVRVISYSPGPIDTPMQGELRKKSEQDFPQVERFRSLHQKGALRSPEEAARELQALLENQDLPYYLDHKS